ncbi:hypothetical protein BDC45DRAFT_534702 [Circinella umbellata]|nr:hypothetical protein BDC45DRAFT_534702 [Circinella umbellata]
MTRGKSTELLDEAAIDILYQDFEKIRKTLVCPGTKTKYNQTGSVRLHGTNDKQNPAQPQFRCSKCRAIFNAITIQQVIKTQSEVPDQDNTSSMDLFDEVSLFDSQPQQMKYILDELQSQRKQLKQHATQFEELNQLREELTIAHDRIAELEKTNRQLKQQLKDQQSQHDQDYNNNEFPTLRTNIAPTTQNSTNSRWAHPLPTQHTKQPISQEKKQRRIEAAARLFQRPSDTHGFQYLYFLLLYIRSRTKSDHY